MNRKPSPAGTLCCNTHAKVGWGDAQRMEIEAVSKSTRPYGFEGKPVEISFQVLKGGRDELELFLLFEIG
jgi:hypothetical protein